MNAESAAKIRQLAVVLASLEPTDSRRILQSLSPRMQSVVTVAAGDLGRVTAAERDAAFAALKPLLFRTVPNRLDSTGRPRQPATLGHGETGNPAADLAAANVGDAVQFSSWAAHPPGPAVAMPGSSVPTAWTNAPPLPTASSDFDWTIATADQWVKILTGERAIIVATVVAHMPPAAAGELLQRLPASLAIESLALLPSIASTTSEVLQEITAQVKSRLNSLRSEELQLAWGRQKVRGIYESLSPQLRRQCRDQLAAAGLDLPAEPSSAESVALGSSLIDSQAIGSRPRDNATAVASDTEQFVESNPAADLIQAGEQPSAASPGKQSNNHVSGGSVDDDPSPMSFDPVEFDAIARLSKSHFAMIVRSLPPDVVLTALYGVDRNWRARFERLLDADGRRRLAERLSGPAPSLRQIDAAQRQLVEAARRTLSTASEPLAA